MSTFKTSSTLKPLPLIQYSPPPCSQHICIVILCPIAAMVNGGNIKKCDGEEGDGTTSLVFLNKWQQINFGILKEKIMRRVLSIHDKMTLVLGLQLYHGRFNNKKINKYFQMCSLRFHYFYFKLNFGAPRGFQKIWGKPYPSMTKWNWSQVSSSTMEDLISIFKKSYFQQDAPADFFFVTSSLILGHLGCSKKCESLMHPWQNGSQVSSSTMEGLISVSKK